MFDSPVLLRQSRTTAGVTDSPSQRRGCGARGGLLLSTPVRKIPEPRAFAANPPHKTLVLVPSVSRLKELSIFSIYTQDVVMLWVLSAGKSVPGTSYSGVKEMILFSLNDSIFMLKDKYIRCIKILK